jgi:DNA repair exonuclease SbcCD ATPase subunit/DNA repair exonuclease SbcCD nuclease subunit
MKLIVCSDLHLDDCTYGKADKSGLTFRTLDHMAAFEWVVDRAIGEDRPDMLVICGDIYESPLPPNNVREFFNRQLVRLSEAGILVRIIVGNHDCSKFHSAIQPLRAIPIKGLSVCVDPIIEVCTGSMEGNTMLYLPYSMRVERREQTQKENFMEFAGSWREKAIAQGYKEGDKVFFFSHFGISGALMNDGFRNPSSDAMTLDDMVVMGADYSLLGDYHGYQPFKIKCGHVLIPGSLERTDFGDMNSSKGLLLYDSGSIDLPDTGKFRHVPYQGTRPFIQIEGDEQKISDAIASHAKDDSMKGAIVKIVFNGTVEGYRTYEFKKKDIKESLESKMGATHVFFEDCQHDPEMDKKAAEIKEKIRTSPKLSDDDMEDIIRTTVKLEISDETESEKAVRTALDIMEDVKKEHGRQESSRTAMAVRIHGIKMHNFLRYGDKDNIVELDEGAKEILSMPMKRQQWMNDFIANKSPDMFARWNDDKERRVISIVGMTDGDPKFSNGAGKSTILEAISYAFFERLVREFVDRQERKGVSTVSIVSEIHGETKPESFVEVLFSAGGAMWLLRRGRKSNKSGTDHSPITSLACLFDASGKYAEYMGSHSGRLKAPDNETIARLIGMDYDTFANSVMFGQNDSGKFIKGTDKMRKDILMNVLHLWMLDYCLDKIREMKKTVIATIDSLNAQAGVLSSGEDRTPELRRQVSEMESGLLACSARLESKSKDLEAIRESMSKLGHDNLSSNVASIEAEIARLAADTAARRSEFERRMSAASRVMTGISSEMESIDREKARALSAIEVADKEISSFKEDWTIEELDLVAKAKEAKPKRVEQANMITSRLSSTVKDIGGIEGNISLKNAEISKLTALKKKCLGGNTVKCSSCNSMVGEGHLDSEISKMQHGIKDLEPTLEALRASETADRTELSDVNKKIANCDRYIASEASLVASMSAFRRSKDRIAEMQAVLLRCDDRMKILSVSQAENSAEMEAAKAGVSGVEASAEEAKQALNAKHNEAVARLRGVEASIRSAKMACEAAEKAVREESSARDSLLSSKARAEAQIEEIRQRNDRVCGIVSQAMEKQAELTRVKVLEKVFGINGIPSKIMERYMPLMNSYVAEYLDVISNHKIRARMSMDHSGEIDLEISGDGASVAELLSGGELVKTKLGFSIGLGMLSFVRSACTPEFICLDEIFAPVDTGTKDYVFQTIEKLKEHFRDIIVISHDTALLARIKNSIVVNKVDGISKIDRQHYQPEPVVQSVSAV